MVAGKAWPNNGWPGLPYFGQAGLAEGAWPEVFGRAYQTLGEP